MRLIAVYDLREKDELTGERIELPAENKNECGRCGRLHAVIWEVEDDRGRVHLIGSGCAKRAFDGWEPDAEDLRKAKKRAREDAAARTLERRKTRLAGVIAPVLLAISRLKPPAPVRLDNPFADLTRGREIWGDRLSGVKVWTTPEKGVNAERLICYEEAWYADAAGIALAEAIGPFPRYPAAARGDEKAAGERATRVWMLHWDALKDALREWYAPRRQALEKLKDEEERRARWR